MTQKVEKEFNNWVLDGRNQGMQNRHFFMWKSIFKEGNFKKDSFVLDLCCGDGWSVLETAKKIKNGFVVGVDISTSMLGNAAAKKGSLQNTLFLNNDTLNINFAENQFTHIFSIEALYYIKNISSLFKKVSRWLKPNGLFLLAINYYAENTYTRRWASQINIPLYSRSSNEYIKTLEKSGLKIIKVKRIFDESPLPKKYQGRWFKDINELEKFRKEGTLLIVSQKNPLCRFQKSGQ
jgi:ubiquinone/menaquinone biosynthesis C-methylase UbiE